MKQYIQTIIMVILIIGLFIFNRISEKQTIEIIDNKITETYNNILLRMNKHALIIQGVQRIIDSSTKLDSETSFIYAEEIVNTANRYENISVSLLTSVFFHESRFNAFAESKAGAQGMGQIMPETAYMICLKWNKTCTDSTVFEYTHNIRATAWYLDFLYKIPKNSKGDIECTVASYNGGSRQAYRWDLYRKYEAGLSLDSLEMYYMNILANETKNYVKNVIHMDSIFENRINNELPTNS